MTASHLDLLLRQAERRAVVQVVRSRTELTLAQLGDLLAANNPRAVLLGSVTVGELLAESQPGSIRLSRDGGPPIDVARLEAARQCTGASFDQCIREVLAEVHGRAVAASYLRARVGGPRWKLQSALARLLAAGLIERSGTTSATRYWIVDARHPSRDQ